MSVTSHRQIQVLHVDDEPSFSELTKTFLQREDDRFTVETATSADDGLQRIDERLPDCVVSDYNMPGMDGLEFLEAVRAKYPDLPFILFTGKGSEAVASDAISAGVTDYLQKQSGTEQYGLLANRIQNAVTARWDAKEATRQQDLMRRVEVLGATGGWELRVESENLRLTDGIKQIYDVETDHNLSLEEVIGFYEPDAQEQIRSTIDDAIEDGYGEVDDLHLRTATGEKRVVEGNAELVETDDDSTVLRGVIRDVTDREERQRELEQIETLFQHAQDSLFLIDVAEEFTVERVNPAWEDAMGLSVERVRGQTPRDIIGEQPGTVAEAKYDECIQRREPLQYEETVELDGEVTHWVTRIAPVVVDGTVEYIAGSTRDITEQRQRQQDLEQARDLMSNMEALADAGAWKYDSESDRLMITDGTRRLYGLDTDTDLTLEAALDAVHPDDRDRLADRLTNCLETGEPYEIDVRLTTPDGAQRWLTAQGERVSESEAGSVVRGYIRDITEHQAYERDLKRYRTVFNELPDPVVVYDEEGQYDLVNDAAAEIRDTPREELTGTTSPYLEQIREENPAEYDALVEGTRDTLQAELTDEFSGRGRRTLACNLARVTAGMGSAGIVIVTRDITDRKERKTELEEYETIIEALTDAVYVLDEEGRFTYVNDEFVELVGYDRETILGNTPSLIKDEEAIEQAEHQLGRLLSSDGPETVTFEVTLHPNGGDPVVCEDRMGVLPYDGDEFDGSVGTLRDITAWKEREQELERQNERLEEFASIVSHDLRNPLAVAEGNLELAQDTCESDHLIRAANAIDRSQALIDGLLTLAREGDAVATLEPVALADAAESSWQTVETGPATIETDTRQAIRADWSRLQQLLENLYRNAVEHGGDNVTVSVGAMDDGFYLADTGPGIPEADREEVFEAGYSTAEEGTGFGLRIAEQVANAHGWEITVTESEQGGARFELTGVEFAER